MSLDARRSGDAIAGSAEELARLWRSARAQSRPDVWPGLLDGVVHDLLVRLGVSLAAGSDPALVWRELSGLARLDARDPDRSLAEIEAEWDLLEAVLRSACEALSADDEVREWLARAVSASRDGVRTLDRSPAPRRLVIVWWLSGPSARRRAAPVPAPR